MIKIRDEVSILLDEIIYCRRYLHQYLEWGLNTKQFLISKLIEYGGFEIKEGFAKNGFVAYLRDNDFKSSIAFRSDMDTLSFREENEIDFKSKIDGCSHDAQFNFNEFSLLYAIKENILLEKMEVL